MGPRRERRRPDDRRRVGHGRGPGEDLDGVPYAELLAAHDGVLKIHDVGHEIVKPRRRKPEPPARPPRRRKPGK
jgi:hypothetical protein